jgi:hypothetical protein
LARQATDSSDAVESRDVNAVAPLHRSNAKSLVKTHFVQRLTRSCVGDDVGWLPDKREREIDPETLGDMVDSRRVCVASAGKLERITKGVC